MADQRQIEVALIAHVACDRTALHGRTRPKLSAPARHVVRLLESTPAAVPLSPELVWVALWQLPDSRRQACAQLTEDAALLTVADLTFLARDTVLELLGSIARSEAPYLPPPKTDIAPWKRRARSTAA